MKQKIIARLVAVICEKGYSEMSISSISEATGLKKSSLYHFFPEGKAQIALEIVLYVDNLLTQAFSDLINKKTSFSETFSEMLDVLTEFYQHGQRSCLIEIMTITFPNEQIQLAIETLLLKLIDTFKTVFLLNEHLPYAAETLAIEVVTRIQGSLILSRAMRQPSFFMNQMSALKKTFGDQQNLKGNDIK